MDECTICQKPVDGGTPTVRLGEKGCIGIQATNINHQCPVEVKAGGTVHIQCWKDFTTLTLLLITELSDLILNSLTLNPSAYFVPHLLNSR